MFPQIDRITRVSCLTAVCNVLLSLWWFTWLCVNTNGLHHRCRLISDKLRLARALSSNYSR